MHLYTKRNEIKRTYISYAQLEPASCDIGMVTGTCNGDSNEPTFCYKGDFFYKKGSNTRGIDFDKVSKTDCTYSYRYRSGLALRVSVLFCQKCKCFQPVWTKLRSTYNGHMQLSHTFINRKMEDDDGESLIAESYICAHCGTQYRDDPLIVAKHEGTKINIPSCVSVYMEKSNCGHEAIKVAMYYKYARCDEMLQFHKSTDIRFSFDLDTGNLYFMHERDTKEKGKLNRFFSNINTQSSQEDNLRLLSNICIPTGKFLFIARRVKEYYATKFPELKDVPLRYYLTGVDLNKREIPLVELARLVHSPFLSLNQFMFIRTTSHDLTSIKLSDKKSKSFKLTCLHQITSVRRKRFTNWGDYLKKLKMKKIKISDYFALEQVLKQRFTVDNVRKLLNTLTVRSNAISAIELVDFLNPDLTLFTSILKKYFKQTAGWNEQKFETYMFNMIAKSDCESIDAYLSLLNDTGAFFNNLYQRIVNEDYQPADEEDIASDLYVYWHAEELPTEVLAYCKRYLRNTPSFRDLHDKLVGEIMLRTEGNKDIIYNDGEEDLISKNSHEVVNGEEYEIKLVHNTKELCRGTNEMHICVATYCYRVSARECNIAFLVRRGYEDVPYEYLEGCIELDKTMTTVKQIKGRLNNSILPELKPFVSKWMSSNKLESVTSDLELTKCVRRIDPKSRNPYAGYIRNVFINQAR